MPDIHIALSLVWKIAACAKAQPALDSNKVRMSILGEVHSLEVYATIYTGRAPQKSLMSNVESQAMREVRQPYVPAFMFGRQLLMTRNGKSSH